MASVHKYTLVLHNPGDGASQFAEFFTVLQEQLHTVRLFADCTVQLDWSELIAFARDVHQTFADVAARRSEQPSDGTPSWDEIAPELEKPFKRLPVRIPLEFEESRDESRSLLPDLLSRLFLVLNLTAPGCIEFEDAELEPPDSRGEPMLPPYHDIFLRCVRDFDYPPLCVSAPTLARTEDWVLHSGLFAGPETPKGTSTSLVALLNIAINADVGFRATDLVWVCHGLEGLFRTPNALSKNLLASRIPLLFPASPSQLKHLRKQLTRLYDLRGAFVHGGMRVPRPLAFYREPPLVVDEVERASSFGLRIIIATLQELIRRGHQALEFREVLDLGELDTTS